MTRAARAVTTALLLAAGLAVLVPYAYAMATTSLWTDEIWTIQKYSGRGPLATLTEYHEPNNHVFFNLLNSLTPGRTSVAPLRARLFSFAATFAFLGLAFAFFARSGAPEWGALLFSILAIQRELLDLVLQARGYAFLCLFALLSTLLARRLLGEVTRRRLAALAVASVLGAWTVPTFAFFAAPLWVLVLAARRRRDVLLAAVSTAMGIALVYAPVASSLLYQTRHFADEWGRQYAHLSAVKDTVAQYLLQPLVAGAPATTERRGVVILCALLAALLSWAAARDREEAARSALVLGACGAFFALCLILKTPFVRTTAFVVVPIAFCLVALLRSAAATKPAGRALLLLFGAAACAGEIAAARSFRFLPHEQWKELAATLRDTFPPRTRFFANANDDFLRGYLAPGYEPSGLDVAAVARGEEVYLDTPLVETPQGRIDGRKVIPTIVEFRIPQRRARYQAIWLCPPEHAGLAARCGSGGPALARLVDRDPATGAPCAGPLALELEAGRTYRSVVIISGDGQSLAMRTVPEGPVRVRTWDGTTLVGLSDRPVRSVLVDSGAAGVREAWAYPSR